MRAQSAGVARSENRVKSEPPLAANLAHADSILDHVMAFVEANTEAEIV